MMSTVPIDTVGQLLPGDEITSTEYGLGADATHTVVRRVARVRRVDTAAGERVRVEYAAPHGGGTYRPDAPIVGTVTRPAGSGGGA